MKALSIQQPWAWLIAHGFKNVENRTWPTSFRGKFLIHAGKKLDAEGLKYVQEVHGSVLDLPETFDLGGIVGEAAIVNCTDEMPENYWFCGPYGFVIENAKPFPFRPYRGQLGFFDVEDEVRA